MKTAIFLLATIIASALANGETPEPGSGRFDFRQAEKTVPVWYYLSENVTPDSPILFVMHGVKRDAERYRKEWIPLAKQYGFIIIAPEFSREEFPKDNDYSQGSVLDENDRPRPFEQTAFSFIEPIFDTLKVRIGNRTSKYQLYGHSAGAQFAHRFLYFVPDARVTKVVAANAGWWMLPDMELDFPFGLKGAPCVTDEVLKTMLQRPLVLLLGTNDTDPNDANLNRSDGAMAQGPHRFARGNFMYEYGQRQATALGVKLEWKLDTAEGIGHSDNDMSVFAAEWLFGKKAGPK